jgi:hypothetical protein
VRVTVAVLTILLGVPILAHAEEPSSPAGASAVERIERARKATFTEHYQAELPRYQSGDRTGSARKSLQRPGRRGNGRVAGRDGRWVDTRERTEPRGVSSLMQLVMWGLLIVLGALFVVWIASELSKYGGNAELPAGESQIRMRAAVDSILDRPLGDADELARRGEYAEAIHTLLLRTLQELVRSAAVRVAPAMTSREILARVPLLADARDALAGLITAVEITHFGEEPANANDYQRCREQFHVFATALRSSGQPARGPRTVAA